MKPRWILRISHLSKVVQLIVEKSLSPDFDTKFHVSFTCILGKHFVSAPWFTINCPFLMDSRKTDFAHTNLGNSWKEGHCLIPSFHPTPLCMLDFDMKAKENSQTSMEGECKRITTAVECVIGDTEAEWKNDESVWGKWSSVSLNRAVKDREDRNWWEEGRWGLQAQKGPPNHTEERVQRQGVPWSPWCTEVSSGLQGLGLAWDPLEQRKWDPFENHGVKQSQLLVFKWIPLSHSKWYVSW